MKQLIIDWIRMNPGKVSAVTLTIIIIIVMLLTNTSPTPQELEAKLKAEIQKLDSERDTMITEYTGEVNKYNGCISKLNTEKGTTTPVEQCYYKAPDVIANTNASNNVSEAVQTNT